MNDGRDRDREPAGDSTIPSTPPVTLTRRKLVAASEEALATMWEARAASTPLACASCGGANVALVIAEHGYRWCCVPCGWSSLWFGVFEGQVRAVAVGSGGASVGGIEEYGRARRR
jgi:hypothetical protein